MIFFEKMIQTEGPEKLFTVLFFCLTFATLITVFASLNFLIREEEEEDVGWSWIWENPTSYRPISEQSKKNALCFEKRLKEVTKKKDFIRMSKRDNHDESTEDILLREDKEF
jgi:hypothetical protein